MPVLGESDLYVGGDAIASAYVASIPVVESTSSPLSTAIVSDDFRILSSFPAGWSNPYDSSIQLDDFVFDGSGAVHPGSNALGGDIYYYRDIPAGQDFWQMTCVYHLYFPNPAPTPWYNGLEITIIHDPDFAYNAERYNGIPQARNDSFTRPPRLSVYAYGSGINYGSSNIFLKSDELDFTPFEDVEMVIVTWADEAGYHVVATNDSQEVFRIDRSPHTIPVSYTTLNKLVWQNNHNLPDDVLGESAWTLKGFYVLPTPTTEAGAEEIASFLLGTV